jgi:hypothetical protein
MTIQIVLAEMACAAEFAAGVPEEAWRIPAATAK